MALDPEKINKPLRKLRKMLKRFPRRPSPDLIHDLRTRTRRIESAVRALGLDEKSNERKLLTALKPLRSNAGKVRDMDVLTSLAMNVEVGAEEDSVVQLIEHLGAERARHVDKLRRLVSRKGKQARRRLKRSLRFIGGAQDNRAASEWSAHGLAAARELSNELVQWPRLSAQNLHPYRLKVKELRYVLQLPDEERADFVKALGEVKDAIGEWHDWQELGRIAEEVLEQASGSNVLKSIGSTTAAKFKRAMRLANRVREQYLKVPRRESVGRKSSTALRQPAREAASRLAA